MIGLRSLSTSRMGELGRSPVSIGRNTTVTQNQRVARKMASKAAISTDWSEEDMGIEGVSLYEFHIDKSMFHPDVTIFEEEEGLIDKETRDALERHGTSFRVVLETSRDYRRLTNAMVQFQNDTRAGKYKGVALEDALRQSGIPQSVIDFGKSLSDEEWNDFLEDFELTFQNNTPFGHFPKSKIVQELQQLSLEEEGSPRLEAMKMAEKESYGYNTWLIDLLRPFDKLETESYSKSKAVNERILKAWKNQKKINSPRELFIGLLLAIICAAIYKTWEWNTMNKHEQEKTEYLSSEEPPDAEILDALYRKFLTKKPGQ